VIDFEKEITVNNLGSTFSSSLIVSFLAKEKLQSSKNTFPISHPACLLSRLSDAGGGGTEEDVKVDIMLLMCSFRTSC
jgi:hypothetical protein